MHLITHLATAIHPEKLHSIPGWLSDREADTLFAYAQRTPLPRVVELGSFCGKSTVALAAGVAPRNGTVVACDLFPANYQMEQRGPQRSIITIADTWQEFHASLAICNVSQYVIALRLDHAAFIANFRGSLGMAFIDGTHTYLAAKNQGVFAWEHLVPGGYLVFDDYLPGIWPEVVQAVDELTTAWRVPIQTTVGKLAIIEKSLQTSL